MNELQRSESWFNDRLGCVTASRVVDIVKGAKDRYLASRNEYMAQLIIERLNGEPTISTPNSDMQWGIDNEAMAKVVYEEYRAMDFIEVINVGFIKHKDIAFLGASPDGLVESDGLIEIKCPKSHTHLATLDGKPIDRKYIYQMQTQMMCTGRKWCDFVSFDPRFPTHLQLKIIRVNFDEALAKEIEYEVIKFNKELEDKLNRLKVA